MWDYIAQTRQSEFRRDADARRLVRLARARRHLTPSETFQSMHTRISNWFQPRQQATTGPLISAQEMQPCVDA